MDSPKNNNHSENLKQHDAAATPHASKDKLEAAFLARKAEIDAIADDDTRATGVDVMQSASMMLGALPGIRRYREALAKLNPMLGEDVDLIEESIMACEFTYIELQTLSEPPEPVTEMVELGRKKLERLLVGASGLVDAGLFPDDYLSAVRGGRAYQDLAVDLLYLARLYIQRASTIASKTHIVEADWTEAQEIGQGLLNALQRREEQASQREAAVKTRNKAKVVTVTRWDRLRRGMTYERWDHGDVDEIVPSLYAARMKRKPASADIETDDTVLSPINPPVPPIVTAIVGGAPSPAPVPVKSATTLPLSEDPFSA